MRANRKNSPVRMTRSSSRGAKRRRKRLRRELGESSIKTWRDKRSNPLCQTACIVGGVIDAETDTKAVAAIVDDDVVCGQMLRDRGCVAGPEGEKSPAAVFIPSQQIRRTDRCALAVQFVKKPPLHHADMGKHGRDVQAF